MWYWIKSSERPPKWPGRWSIWCMKKSWEKCGWVLLLVGWVGGGFLSLKTRQGGTYWHCLIRKGWMEERWTQSQTLLSGAHKRRAKPTRHTQEIHIFKDRIYFTIKLVKHQQRGPESVWILHPQGRSMFIWMRHLTSCLNLTSKYLSFEQRAGLSKWLSEVPSNLNHSMKHPHTKQV